MAGGKLAVAMHRPNLMRCIDVVGESNMRKTLLSQRACTAGIPKPAARAFRILRPGGAAFCAMLVAIAAMVMGPDAVAASAQTCYSRASINHALSAIVNISVVKVLGTDNEDGSEGSKDPAHPVAEHFAEFVGSGVIVDPSGIIVTNKHVIKDAAIIRVTFADRTQAPAQLVAACALMDLAVIKVDVPYPLPTLEFADSDKVQVADPVVAIGNPLGIGTSVSTGVVSGLDRDLMRSPFDDFIQTDATINPGNSGGPLLDCDGKVIGIDTALLSNSKILGSIGIGFAMPSNEVRFVAAKLQEPNAVMPDWVGLHLQDLTAQLATVFGRPDMNGAIVTWIDPNSPAARGDLKAGDIILSALGQEMPDSRAVLRTVATAPEGARIPLRVWRHNEMMDITLNSVPWPQMLELRSEVLASPENISKAESTGLGLKLAGLTPADRQQSHLGDVSGVLIDAVAPGSMAYNMNLQPGDVILQVGDQPATSPDEVQAQFARAKAAPGDLVAMLVRGKAGTRWTTLWLGTIDPTQLVTRMSGPETASVAHSVEAHETTGVGHNAEGRLH
jgi:serine protease Do